MIAEVLEAAVEACTLRVALAAVAARRRGSTQVAVVVVWVRLEATAEQAAAALGLRRQRCRRVHSHVAR